MRSNFLLPFLIILILNFSCNSDDDNSNNEPEKLILGNWFIIDKVINGEIIPYTDHEECGRDYLEFKNDSTIWLVNISDCEKEFIKLGSYSFKNDILKLDDEIVEILKLDSWAC